LEKLKEPIKEFISMIENYTAKMLLYEGIVAYRKKNYAESIEYFSQVINLNPDNELAHLCRGSAYLMLEKIEESISDFNRAIALNPLYARAYHQRGTARELMDDIANAYRDFDRALEFDPEFTAAYQSRDCILSPDCHTDLVTQNNEMVEHLAAISVEQFIKDIPVYQGI
jgi:tetratricopeptide (TPR) repeat protein